EDWNNGHEGTAAGRAVPAILGMVGGVGWFGRGTKLLKSLRVPRLPVNAQRAAETAADQAADAARRGDVDMARAAADTADDEARAVEKAAAENPTAENKEAAAKARQAADEADSVVLDADVRAVLRKSELGAKASRIIWMYGVTVVYHQGGGTFFRPPREIHVGVRPGDTEGWHAAGLAHESFHVEGWHTGKSVNGLADRMGRKEWVDAMVEEEAGATAREMEVIRELRQQGEQIREHPLEKTYFEAFEEAVRQGGDGAQAGTEALLEAFRSGRALSHTGEPYADTYGRHWDEINSPSAKGPGK
ncbi:hypothetical protein, partial [Actinomadura sp. HBU206391]|uniref:hypothetical protein n=1 Tax=Actinomadura sp. HBU206391 TaxID=2731692 RepID=UPI001C9BCFF4|nr:hypothetical protein [Actinomadura sp. HBU206391]